MAEDYAINQGGTEQQNDENIDLRQSDSPRTAFKRARDKSLRELSGSFVSGQLSSARVNTNSRSPSPLLTGDGTRKVGGHQSQLRAN